LVSSSLFLVLSAHSAPIAAGTPGVKRVQQLALISELTIEAVGIPLTGNPWLMAEHMASRSANAAAHPATATISATNQAGSPPETRCTDISSRRP
jgi:hypothetical protein